VSDGDRPKLSRRDLLRRGAVVGGTVLWVAPAVQGISTPAFAEAMGQSPGTCAACYCWNGAQDKSQVTGDFCTDDGTQGHQTNRETCRQWCQHEGPFSVIGAPGGPFRFSAHCSGTTSCACSTRNDALALTGVSCSLRDG
jgi:hypothetical protein